MYIYLFSPIWTQSLFKSHICFKIPQERDVLFTILEMVQIECWIHFFASMLTNQIYYRK